jgi:hypothetical protein
MKSLKNLLKTETLDIQELMQIKGAADVQGGGCKQNACTKKSCNSNACTSGACQSYACHSKSCKTTTCQTEGCIRAADSVIALDDNYEISSTIE